MLTLSEQFNGLLWSFYLIGLPLIFADTGKADFFVEAGYYIATSQVQIGASLQASCNPYNVNEVFRFVLGCKPFYCNDLQSDPERSTARLSMEIGIFRILRQPQNCHWLQLLLHMQSNGLDCYLGYKNIN